MFKIESNHHGVVVVNSMYHVKMLKVGEDTGKTPDILEKLADFYEEEVNQITQNLSSIIEPVLMVVIGVAVAFFAIAIIKPIYSLMNLV
jgi:type IV pilus assembly protein PilC